MKAGRRAQGRCAGKVSVFERMFAVLYNWFVDQGELPRFSVLAAEVTLVKPAEAKGSILSDVFEHRGEGDKNLLQMGRSIRGSGVVCQGKTWRRMLGTGGLGWTRASQAGVVRCERKGEQARDLLRGGILRGKGASITLHAAYRFRPQTERSVGYSGST